MHQFSQVTITIVLYTKVFVALKQSARHCDLVSDDRKQCFIKDMLLSADHNSNQLAVDKKSNTLYFSFNAGHGDFNPAMLSIETKKLNLLKGVKDAYAIACNDSNGDVYFGGSNGIYKYIPEEKKLLRLQFRDLDVWWLFIQRKIFYVQFPRMTAYVYAKRSVKPVKSMESSVAHQLVLDFEKNIFFINASGIFHVKQSENLPVMLKDSPTFLGLAVDNQGKVHMCSEDGIYVVNSDSGKMEVAKLVGIRGVLAMAFDKNNHLIYSDSHDLVRLFPMQKREVSTAKMPSQFRSVFVCHKSCDVLKMRVNH